MNTSRTTFAIDRDVLRARAGVSIYYTIRSTPRVRALSRGEDDVVDGDAAGTKGEGGSADGRGHEKRRNRKNSSSDSTTSPLGVSKIARSCRSTPRAMRSASEGHDAFARVGRSFATVVMPQAWSRHTRSDRSLGAPRRVPHGAASIARGRGRKIFRDAGSFEGSNATDPRSRLGWTREEIMRNRGWQTYKMSFTKNPTNPMTMNPRPVRVAILLNSLRSGLVHFLTRRYESLANSFTGLTAISATSMVSGALRREAWGARRGSGRVTPTTTTRALVSESSRSAGATTDAEK